MIEGSPGALRRIAMSPSAASEPPANLEMRSERMILGHARHYACISKKRAIRIFDGPARNTMLSMSSAVAVELQIAFHWIDRSTEVSHDLWIGVHFCECCAMTIVPFMEP
ncbi:hypothetical protein VP03_31930 [Sinorhizobium meliloti]|nr:hypothetical protein VP03_31930 [Sinorhizobium meliloti]